MTENELLAELIKELSIPEIEPHEITAKMLADKLGVTGRHAYARLTEMVEAGRLKSRYVRGTNRKVLAFSKVE